MEFCAVDCFGCYHLTVPSSDCLYRMKIYNGVVKREKWYAYANNIIKRNAGAAATWQQPPSNIKYCRLLLSIVRRNTIAQYLKII